MHIVRTLRQLFLPVILSGVAVSPTLADQPLNPAFEPGYRPANNSDEGGFWLKVDKLEREIQRSPQLIRDPKLTRYIDELVCRLAGDYCADIRVYIIKNPNFNATMYPNGMMHVWTGLLLRVENEAQLAAVLGHEIGHYLSAHQIERWRSLRNGASAAIFLDMVLTAGLATMAVASSNSAFGRDQEMEADLFGLSLMSANGYAPSEAVSLWDYIDREQDADQSKAKRNVFFATHPLPEARIDSLQETARSMQQAQSGDFIVDRQGYLAMIKPHYFDFMQDHFDLQEHQQTELLLTKHRDTGFPQSQIDYFKGRLETLVKQEDYQAKAEKAFLSSINADDTPAQAYRETAYLYLKSGRKEEAKSMFRQYLNESPDAPDKKMIDFYLSSTGNSND